MSDPGLPVEQARAFGRLADGLAAGGRAGGRAAGGWWLAAILGKRPRVGPFHYRGHKWPHTGQKYP